MLGSLFPRVMLHLLKPSSSHKIPFLRPLLLIPFPYSTTTSTSSSSSQSSFLPFLNFTDATTSEPTSTEIAASVKEWFKSSSSSSSSSYSSSQFTLLLDQIYFHLANSPDGPTLDSSLSSLKGLRLSEPLVLQFLSHRPHPSAIPPDSNLLILRIKFFDWSGRQKIGNSSNAATYRHTRSAFHAVFRLLSRAHLASSVLVWLRAFRSSRPSPFISAEPASNHPRLHDTLVVGYAVAGRPELALQLLARMRFCGLDLDYFSYHVLLNSLVEAGCFDYVDSLLDQIADRGLTGPVTDCIVVKSLCRQNRLDDAIAYLDALRSEQKRDVAERTVATLVHALCRKERFDDAGRLVEEYKNDEAYGVWITSLVGAGKLDMALEFLHCKKAEEDYSPEDFHYGKLISRLLSKNRLEQVYDVLVEMMEDGISPGRDTMNAALCFFCKAGMVDVALQLYQSRLELGMSPTKWVYNHLLSALCRNGNINEVCKVLKESMQQGYFPGKQTFNILANALCRDENVEKLFCDLLDEAVKKNLKPTTSVLARYISALCKTGNSKKDVETAYSVFQMADGEAIGSGRFKYAYTSLIRAFISLKWVDVLPSLLIQMQERGHSPSRSLYCLVVSSLCDMGWFEEVLNLLNKQMELKVSDPRTFYNYFIEGAARSKKLEMAREIYRRMGRAGVMPNLDTKIVLLNGYLKGKKISDALSFFNYLHTEKVPSTKLYSIFISGLCEAGKPEQAVEYWQEMREKGLIPSLECYEKLVLTLCFFRKYDVVVRVLADFRETGRKVSPFICNVLMFHTLKGQELLRTWFSKAKEGKETWSSSQMLLGQLIAEFSHRITMKENLESLEEIVGHIPVDIYTYNMLLRGLSMVGQMDYACSLFNKMRKKGYEPNRYTYDILVHGFCKQGKRKDAKRWMEQMERSGYRPTWYTIRIYNNTE